MKKTLLKYLVPMVLLLLIPIGIHAEDQPPTQDTKSTEDSAEQEVQDMSDPLAVYTQLGIGYTDKGLNIKAGMSYDSGKPSTMAMNLLEIMGIFGDTLGWRDYAVDGIDSLRFRNFNVDMTNGRGGQIDVSYNLNSETGSAAYALMQALPPMSIFQFYPLAGVGLAFANNLDDNPLWGDESSSSGLSVPGAFWLAGFYAKITITDKIWLNYNPFYFHTLAGSSQYKDNAYGFDESSVLAHEAAISYQITPIMNIRYFANWTTELDFADGGHRIEFNYQF